MTKPINYFSSDENGNENEYEISVIIPAYNAAETIGRAVDSVRIQKIASLEIIIIDDGSTDNTVEIIEALTRHDCNIHLVRMAKNSGVSAARNEGIRQARGEFLAFLDADDVWLADKLSKQITEIRTNPKISLVSCNSHLISESGEYLKEGHVNRPPVEGIDAWKTLLIYNFLPTPTVLTYRHLVQTLGGFNENLAVGEDLDLWIRLALMGEVRVLKDVLIHYYDSSGSLMKRYLSQSETIVMPMLERHLFEQKKKLTVVEIRNIRGLRSFQMGCNLFFAGEYLESIPIFMRAAISGVRPIKSLLYIPRALFMAVINWTLRKI